VLLEAYLLDFDGDLYGEEARVSFVDRLRDDRRFPTVEALVEQMGRDVEAARVTLAGATP
jgi:riboflavin kinase/FMN adenylyltransferase